MTLKMLSEKIRDNIKNQTQKPAPLVAKLAKLEKENEELKNDNKVFALAIAEMAQTVYGGALND